MDVIFELYSVIKKDAKKKWHWMIPFNYDDRGWRAISEEEVMEIINEVKTKSIS